MTTLALRTPSAPAPVDTTPLTCKTALELIGGLSHPSKMPWWDWSTPASACITGGKPVPPPHIMALGPEWAGHNPRQSKPPLAASWVATDTDVTREYDPSRFPDEHSACGRRSQIIGDRPASGLHATTIGGA